MTDIFCVEQYQCQIYMTVHKLWPLTQNSSAKNAFSYRLSI